MILWTLAVDLGCLSLIFLYRIFYNFPLGSEVNLPNDNLDIFFMFLMGAPIEEMIFRYFPSLIIFGLFGIKNSKNMLLVIMGVLVSSAIFGLVHGSINNIFIQGVAGVEFWFVFLYSSRMFKDPEVGIISSSAIHFLSNMLIWLNFTLSS